MLPAVPHMDALGNPISTADGLPPCAAGVTSGLPNFVSNVGGVIVTNPVTGCWPETWPTDGRDGGVPDPTTAGPDIIVIGSEGGLLPKPAVLPSTPIGYEYFRRSVTVLNVLTKGLMLGPAERADAIIDFSKFAGKTLIFYNDAPAPVPAFDTRIDYYTGNPDQSAGGGAPPTLAGFGPNTRTIMQIRVAAGTPVSYTGCTPVGTPGMLDCTVGTPALAGPLATAFGATQEKPIVAQAAYGSFPDQFAKIYTGSSLQPTWTFIDGNGVSQTAAVPNPTLYPTPPNLPPGATIPLLNKAIQELFEPVYGRMNATLGVELPFTSATIQTTIPLGYIDPSTETVPAGQTQMWKITHNGVDTHFVHFHLVNVQVINRVGWDGTIKPPDDNEVGWKETVRMNQLEDIIVAARMKVPPLPFGISTSSRAMDVTQPTGPGNTMGFTQVDPATGNPAVVYNTVADFGWEYVWHCHILGHEENDMMRPLVVQVVSVVPTAPVLSVTPPSTPPYVLTWTDATPPPSLGNPANEIGFFIQRATGAGAFVQIGTALANATTFTDGTAVAGTTYSYRVAAYNAAGSATSNIVTVGPPLPAVPTNLAAVINAGPLRITLTWIDASFNETSFAIWRSANGGAFAQIGTVARSAAESTATGGAVTFNNTTNLVPGTTYGYYVTAVNAAGPSLPSNTVSVNFSVPAAPTNLAWAAVRITGNLFQDAATLTWTDNANNETGFQIQRSNSANFFLPTTFTVGANVTTFSQNISRAFNYYYRVRATNAVGNSGWSNVVFVTTP